MVSSPILVSGGQRFESSPVHFFSLLSPIVSTTTGPTIGGPFRLLGGADALRKGASEIVTGGGDGRR